MSLTQPTLVHGRSTPALAVLCVWLAAGGCDRGGRPPEAQPAPIASQPAAGPASAETEPAHQHSHTAPHGGTLVCVGDHAAHLEWVLDPKAARLTMYVLDGGAEGGVRIAAAAVEVRVQPKLDGSARGEPLTLSLDAVASTLTGESVGDTSQFSTQSDQLRGLREFSGVVSSITIKGVRFSELTFDLSLSAEQQGPG